MRTYLVTGVAGFIGHWVARQLLGAGACVVGIDNLNDAYDPRIKHWRLRQLGRASRFRFLKADIADSAAIGEIFRLRRYEAALHLAARAGAPQSVRCPRDYIEANAVGTQNLLDLCTAHEIPKLVLASTSSVYGSGNPMPLTEDADTGRPRSPYAASKKAAEVLAHAHHHVHGLDITVLRYFTVFGPAGRPDMSLFRFIRWIREGEPVILHGDGYQSRDFTYVEDIARGTIAAATPLGYEIVNLGTDSPVELGRALEIIEECLGRKAKVRTAPVHRVDVRATWASIAKARRVLGWQPATPLEEGIERMVRWYEDNRAWASRLELP